LGIQPTSTSKAGEIDLSGRPARTSIWSLSLETDTTSQPGADHHRALETLLGVLAGKEDRFEELRRETQPEQVTIYGGFYADPNYVDGVWLEPAQMRLLANCEIGWGLDIFVESREDADASAPAAI
jgi:hypothetical protein